MSTQQGDVQWFSAVQAAFPDQELCTRIWTEAHQPSRLPQLFEDISRYVLSLKSPQHSIHELPTNPKKRKLEDGAPQMNGAGIANPTVAFECKDVSVQIPARKKLRVQIVGDSVDLKRDELRLVNPTLPEIEYSLPAESIDQVFCLPVPDKQQRQSYFAIIPKPGAKAANGASAEQILFTLNETSPPSLASSASDAIAGDDTYVTATLTAFTRLLQKYGKSVTLPCATEFASARPQSHRKGEKGYHVNAYRGSKEGYLFLLPTGILFGFKKPLAFYPFAAIESISYTSVLQRTFNLVVGVSNPASSNPEAGVEVAEVEFSMLDQEDFAGIDEYVKRHGLNDASLAAGRRAREYGVNKEKEKEKKGEVEDGVGAGVAGEDGLTELQRAEMVLQDQEDEEEEDYEASGGESDGEGEGSEVESEEGEGYEDGEEDAEEDAEAEDEEGVEFEDDDL